MSELRAVAELIAPGAASSCVLLDCRHSLDAPDYGRQAYQAGHIPGAQFASIDEVLSGPLIPGQSGRHPLPCPETLSAQLRAWGINHDSEVVVYDDAQSAYAARAWWLLRWLGHERVKVLDGGLAAWCREGGLLAVTETPRAAGNFVAHLQQDKTISADALLAQLHSPALALLDARALPRFRGEVEPLDPVAGHIPGAVCLPFTDNLQADGRFKSPAELRQRFAPLIDGRTELISSCGSGITACHNILAMVHAGLPEPKLYAGSWSEWISDPKRPVARGEQ